MSGMGRVTREELLDELELDDDTLFLDPEALDEFIIGACEQFGRERVLAYDYDKLIEYWTSHGMSVEEAEEWYSYNVVGAWLGGHTPVYVQLRKKPELTHETTRPV